MKSKEKEKKSIWKNPEKGKTNFGPLGPIQPSQAEHAAPDRWDPPASVGRARALPPSLLLSGGASLSAPVSSCAHSLPLAARWVRSISTDRPFAWSPSLARGPHLSASSPSLTYGPRTPPWTRLRRAFPGHSPHALDLLLSPYPLAHSPCPVVLPCRPPRTPLSHYERTRGAPPPRVVRSAAAVELLLRTLPR